MATNKKPAFPQTPDGVSDWELVFEDPDNGLIPLISSARTTAALRQCTSVVINQLYIRDDDALEVARLNTQFEKLFTEGEAAGNIEPISETVVDLLRQIKTTRIEKAQEYLAEKSQKRRINRRSSSASRNIMKTIYRLIKSPKLLILAGIIVLFMMIGVGGITVMILDDGKSSSKTDNSENTPAKTKQDEPESEPEPEPATPKEKKATPKLEKPVVKKPGMPPTIVMTRIILPHDSNNKRKGIKRVMPILVLANRKDLSSVCVLKPVIYDALNTGFSEILNKKGKITNSELARISREVKTMLNSRLGKKAILIMRLIAGADYRDQPDPRCTLAPEKYLKYLP